MQQQLTAPPHQVEAAKHAPEMKNTTPAPRKNAVHLQTKGNKRAREGLRWLRDMALFYEELQRFLALLPHDAHIEHLTRIPNELLQDARFHNLCKMCQSPTCYMSDIHYDLCGQALEDSADGLHAHCSVKLVGKSAVDFSQRGHLALVCW